MMERYEEAVRTLNTLQSNVETLKNNALKPGQGFKDIYGFLERSGLTLEDIDKLSVIHISGTKGKGSTAAFCESILRHEGFTTGFFSSPHLVEVRERFRINGKPISKELFSSKFWKVYNSLYQTKKVDVSIIEVGIGGEYDSTNIIRQPVVCGITSLGLDHVAILGNNIASIAWNKAGIFKKGVPAVTIEHQPDAMEVILDRSQEKNNPVYVTSCLNKTDIQLGIKGEFQILNASLALQLCKIWKQRRQGIDKPVLPINTEREYCGVPVIDVDPLTDIQKQALKECKWNGRCQTIHRPGITYYLDGAHTIESMQQCVNWFMETSREESKAIEGDVVKILIFNVTGDRDIASMLSLLKKCDFDGALFTPNIPFSTLNSGHSDDDNRTVTQESILKRSAEFKSMWENLYSSKISSNSQSEQLITASGATYNGSQDSHFQSCSVVGNEVGIARELQNGEGVSKTECETHNLPCISSALYWATQGKDKSITTEENCTIPAIPLKFRQASHIQILVAGLYLSGGVLGIIYPDIND